MAFASICRTRSAETPNSSASSCSVALSSVIIEQDQWDVDASERVSTALATLDERSRQILQRRWMTDDKATLHELADEFGVSAERVRQIEANAIKKLRQLVVEEA